MAIDKSTRSIFVSGTVCSFDEINYATLDSDTLDIVNKVFFLNFDTETGQLKAYGNAKSTGQTDIMKYFGEWTHQMCVYNNRVFVPCYYVGDMSFGGDTTYDNGYRNNAILIWDTLGHKIGFIDMPTNSPNRVQPCHLLAPHDSSLYICGFIPYDGTVWFGDTSISHTNSVAYIAKFVDTTFMTPYIHDPQEPGNVSIRQVKDKADIIIHPNPVSTILHVEIPQGESVRSCHVISTTGTRYKEQIMGNTINLERYPTGIYYVEIITNNNIYTQKIIKL